MAAASITHSSPARGFRLTERDLELLEFVAAHRFVLGAHVCEWLGRHRSVAYRRLAGLHALGLLEYAQRFSAQPGWFLITRQGLAAIGSELPVPVVDLGCYRHDAALVWLSLEARRRDHARGGRLLTERQMRVADRGSDVDGERFAVELGDLGPGGRPRRHYPDLVRVDRDGRRAAFELELTLKSRPRLESILVAYGAHPSIASVVYLTDRPAVAAAVTKTVAALGLDSRIRVHLTSQPITPARPPGAWRACRPHPRETTP